MKQISQTDKMHIKLLIYRIFFYNFALIKGNASMDKSEDKNNVSSG